LDDNNIEFSIHGSIQSKDVVRGKSATNTAKLQIFDKSDDYDILFQEEEYSNAIIPDPLR